MKITIIGTHGYRDKIMVHKAKLEMQGHEVRIPAFDSHPELDELGICTYNRGVIEWAEEIHAFWDQRSFGTVFDIGMVFMARKPLKVIYLEPKLFGNFMKQYEGWWVDHEQVGRSEK